MKAAHRPTAQVLGVEVDAVDMESALARVANALHESRKGYVCVTSVHGIMEAQRSPLIAQVHAASEMTIPDGMPLVWVGRMAKELRDKLTAQFPGARIVGTYTPPFRELSPAEEKQLIAQIADLKPDIVWVGLGCPKQELFMSRYLPMLDTKLMFGVGAAFDFHTGRIHDCAPWIKRAGLQWLHRLLQDPGRLWNRYLRIIPAFLWHITLQLTGLQRYPHAAKANTAEKQHRAEVHP
jgi:N-acetylglucosaminyldiphosphoundecaprenol N-acetyl-beta-D-mannosaminyltransferase